MGILSCSHETVRLFIPSGVLLGTHTDIQTGQKQYAAYYNTGGEP